jgi:NTE family protein
MPAIGLALGSGSARGLAHIGVIRAIEESGIKVDMIAGTSIGALIGAAYASGRLDTLEQDFRAIDWKRMGTLLDPVFPRSGLIDGMKIAAFVRAHVSLKTIEQLQVPFCAVATDLNSGEEIDIRKGDLIDAVRASISVPGILSPVRQHGRVLVDGGLANPVPVSAVRALGASIVIAVDLNHNIVAGKTRSRPVRSRETKKGARTRLGGRKYAWAIERMGEGLRTSGNPAIHRIRAWLEKERLPGMVEVLLGSLHIMQEQITESRLSIDRPDLLIRPPLSSVHLLEFDRAEEMIAIGYRSALGPLRAFARELHRQGYR